MPKVDYLKGITLFRRGDIVVHKMSGQEYVVKYVQINKYNLTIMTEDGIGFDSEVIMKVKKEPAFSPDLSSWV